MGTASDKQNIPHDADNMLADGSIVVVTLTKGEYVIRASDHDPEIMLAFIQNKKMRKATKDERDYWCHCYATTDYCGVAVAGLKEWIKWRDSVACR